MSDIVPANDQLVDAVGLEDFGVSDMLMPVLKINHQKGCFEGNGGQEYASLDVIALGFVKQRILWNHIIGDQEEKPWCQAPGYTQGLPDPTHFPYAEAGFENGNTGPLPCSECNLKEWGTHPIRDIPWCGEQHTYVLQLEGGHPAILTLVRSAISASKSYLNGFAQESKPLFVCRTKIELQQNKKGGNTFCTPSFSRGEPTNPEDHGEYATQYRAIRGVITTPRQPVQDDDAAPQQAQQAPQQAQAEQDDDDLPF